ncbi:MAG: S41 family peptidase [Bacteroidota bacterium]
MKSIRIYFLVILLCGCENILIDEEQERSQLNNFELYWNDFDRNYAAFEVRNIDWDLVYIASVTKINSGLSDEEFFDLMSEVTLNFRDIHVDLFRTEERVVYNSTNPNSSNGLRSLRRYHNGLQNENGVVRYSTIRAENIGYIYIPTFSTSLNPLDFEIIDEALDQLKDTDGLILDVRNNEGGNLANQKVVASRFVDNSFIYFRNRTRNGPEHNDFGEPFEDRISPDGPFQYLKPVILLTNRKTASAAESFAMTLRKMNNVTIVGDTTAAGLGINLRRELPNGWSYRMTTGLVFDCDNVTFEGTGVPPDEVVFISKQDSTTRQDSQLLKALELLN